MKQSRLEEICSCEVDIIVGSPHSSYYWPIVPRMVSHDMKLETDNNTNMFAGLFTCISGLLTCHDVPIL